jgi:hypothetical protein
MPSAGHVTDDALSLGPLRPRLRLLLLLLLFLRRRVPLLLSPPLDRFRIVLVDRVVLGVALGLLGQPLIAHFEELQIQARRDIRLGARPKPEVGRLTAVAVDAVHGI